jgi:hypothetical protein
MIFGGSTTILTYTGFQLISAVQAGTLVLTHAQRWQPVLKAVTSGLVTEGAWQVTTADGSTVLLSWDASVLVNDEGWEGVSEAQIYPGLAKGEFLFTCPSVSIVNGVPQAPFVPTDRANLLFGILGLSIVQSCVLIKVTAQAAYQLIVKEDGSCIAGGIVVQCPFLSPEGI